MMNSHLLSACLAGLLLSLPTSGALVFAGDMDDGISTYTEEPISADDEALKTDKNINFIVQQAKAKAQKDGKGKNTNFNDGSGDQNQNSIVVGSGAQTGDIINVVIEKK